MVVGLSSKLGILEAFRPQIFFLSQSTIVREDVYHVLAFRQSWHNFENPQKSPRNTSPSFFFSSATAFSFVLLKFSMGVAALQMTPKTNDIDAETVKNWRRKRFCVEIFNTDDGIYANDGDGGGNENVDDTIGDGFGGGGDDGFGDGFGDVFDDVISSLAPTADGLFDDGIADDLRLTMN